MKLKASEVTVLFFATIIGIAAFITGQLEPKDSYAGKEKKAATVEEAPSFFIDTQTVSEETLRAVNPQGAQQTVQQFFALFEKVATDEADAQTLMQTKALLSSELQGDISTDETKVARDISRTVGLLTPPKLVDVLRTEQNSPASIDVIVSVTTTTEETVTKKVSVITEDEAWKIDSFTIVD